MSVQGNGVGIKFKCRRLAWKTPTNKRRLSVGAPDDYNVALAQAAISDSLHDVRAGSDFRIQFVEHVEIVCDPQSYIQLRVGDIVWHYQD